jgi:iron(III) transport system substrate-binding protein
MRNLLAVCGLAVLALLPNAASARPELRVLTDRTESHLRPFFTDYEKAAGVGITAVFLDKGLISRLESRPTEADLVITKDVELMELAKQKKLLQPIASATIKKAVPARFQDPDRYYFSDSYRARVIFYSKDRVKPEQLKGFEGLADPKWRGRVCLRSGYHDYNLSLFGQMMAAWGAERTRKVVAGLDKNLARTPTGNDRDQARAIAEKKCDVAIANSYYMGIMLSSKAERSWGLATRVFFPGQDSEGSFILRSGLGLTKSKTNVKAATAFLEYLVSEPVQDRIAQLTFAYPVNSKQPLPAINRELGKGQTGIKDGVFKIRSVAPKDIAGHRTAVLRLLDELKFDRPR